MMRGRWPSSAVGVNIEIIRAIRDADRVLIGYYERYELKAQAVEPANTQEE